MAPVIPALYGLVLTYEELKIFAKYCAPKEYSSPECNGDAAYALDCAWENKGVENCIVPLFRYNPMKYLYILAVMPSLYGTYPSVHFDCEALSEMWHHKMGTPGKMIKLIRQLWPDYLPEPEWLCPWMLRFIWEHINDTPGTDFCKKQGEQLRKKLCEKQGKKQGKEQSSQAT
ncbi:hypothetical protein BT96DRAFT_939169 [Gymnopus androsaceus JB14]|uniref:Uncharacterized protein n=1 Tax=Gymnopus androsaceus JB14 TaxID=1447944 RepID=A0A6A4HPX4_9AGAR|nr:hypothetical protein BT96DRAFT_939169 [Gymnopus androsaceus JB14]